MYNGDNGAHCQRCGRPWLGNLCNECMDRLIRGENIKRKIARKRRRLIWDIVQAVLALAAAIALAAYMIWKVNN